MALSKTGRFLSKAEILWGGGGVLHNCRSIYCKMGYLTDVPV